MNICVLFIVAYAIGALPITSVYVCECSCQPISSLLQVHTAGRDLPMCC